MVFTPCQPFTHNSWNSCLWLRYSYFTAEKTEAFMFSLICLGQVWNDDLNPRRIAPEATSLILIFSSLSQGLQVCLLITYRHSLTNSIKQKANLSEEAMLLHHLEALSIVSSWTGLPPGAWTPFSCLRTWTYVAGEEPSPRTLDPFAQSQFPSIFITSVFTLLRKWLRCPKLWRFPKFMFFRLLVPKDVKSSATQMNK